MSRSSQAQTGRLLRFLQLRLSAVPAYPAGSDMLHVVASPDTTHRGRLLGSIFPPLTDAQNLPSGSGFRHGFENNQRNKQDEQTVEERRGFMQRLGFLGKTRMKVGVSPKGYGATELPSKGKR